MRKRLTYANVTSTLALVLAVGAGGAYALDKIGSHQIRNNSVRSADIRDKGVHGRDLAKGAVHSDQIQESSLKISDVAAVRGGERVGCDTSSETLMPCLRRTIRLKQKARVLAVATGDQITDGPPPAGAICQIQVDDVGSGFFSHPGELISDNTSGTATNGFARTLVSKALPPGPHSVALVCARDGANAVRVDNPTLAVLAIGAR